MMASLEPIVLTPTASEEGLSSGALKSLAIMFTQRVSISPQAGYSSRSIKFYLEMSMLEADHDVRRENSRLAQILHHEFLCLFFHISRYDNELDSNW